jgi:hypothetical protein
MRLHTSYRQQHRCTMAIRGRLSCQYAAYTDKCYGLAELVIIRSCRPCMYACMHADIHRHFNLHSLT